MSVSALEVRSKKWKICSQVLFTLATQLQIRWFYEMYKNEKMYVQSVKYIHHCQICKCVTFLSPSSSWLLNLLILHGWLLNLRILVFVVRACDFHENAPVFNLHNSDPSLDLYVWSWVQLFVLQSVLSTSLIKITITIIIIIIIILIIIS